MKYLYLFVYLVHVFCYWIYFVVVLSLKSFMNTWVVNLNVPFFYSHFTILLLMFMLNSYVNLFLLNISMKLLNVFF